MNLGVTPRSRQVATIGVKYCQAGWIPPRKFAWLSNCATDGTQGVTGPDHADLMATVGRRAGAAGPAPGWWGTRGVGAQGGAAVPPGGGRARGGRGPTGGGPPPP